GLAVLRADGLEIVALPRDLDVGVALRVQLLPDLRFGHRLVTWDEDCPSRPGSCDYQASGHKQRGAAAQGRNDSTIHGVLLMLDPSTTAGKPPAFNAALSRARRPDNSALNRPADGAPAHRR